MKLVLLDQEKVKNNMANKGIEWKFNPPGASHLEDSIKLRKCNKGSSWECRHNRRGTSHGYHRSRRSSEFETTDVSKQ